MRWLFIFGLFIVNADCIAQVHIDHIYYDTVTVGDTVELHSISIGCISGSVTCAFSHLNGGVFSTDSDLFATLQDNTDYGTLHLFFRPQHVGLQAGIVVLNVECSGLHCASPFYYDSVYAYARRGQSSVTSDAPNKDQLTTIYDPFSSKILVKGAFQTQRAMFYLFDLTGRLVRQIERDVPAGTSEIDLDASSLPAGCYWYVVRGNGWSKSGKVMKLP